MLIHIFYSIIVPNNKSQNFVEDNEYYLYLKIIVPTIKNLFGSIYLLWNMCNSLNEILLLGKVI